MKKPVLISIISIFCFISTVFSQSGEFYGDSKAQSFTVMGNITVTEFVRAYVEQRIETWQQRGEFEPTAAYQERVNEQTRNAQVQKLTDEALAEFKNLYTQSINWQNLELGKYDADNETFLISSQQLGDIAVNIPLADAPAFRDNWSKVKFEKQDFFVNNDKLVLAKLDLVSHTGKRYTYDSKESTVYYADNIKYNFDPIEVEVRQDNVRTEQTRIESREMTVGKADVAVNIPVTSVKNNKTFAVIIANENYQRPSPNVDYAINDGSTFKEYCEKTLGIPADNIRYYSDATSGVVDNAINWITNIAKAYSGEAKLIFYYAGHGTLDQSVDRAPYLLPVDVNPNNLRLAVKLEDLYNRLSEYPSQNVLVFLDACFSGSNRGEGMVADGGRFVVDEPKFEPIKGNMVVFTAASGKESAWPYKEKQHGLFTYYLLKKLQESKGDVSLQQLSDYIEENVTRRSTVLDNKQTPQIIVSPFMGDSWKNLKLR